MIPTRSGGRPALRRRATLQRAFSLAEMLMVLLLVAILMAVSLPAFTVLLKGSGVSVGARTIAAKMNGARSYALSQRCYVALVFPHKSDSDVPNSLKNLAFRPAVVVPVSGQNYFSFSKWVPGENWQQMPRATFFSGPKIATGDIEPEKIVNGRAVKNCVFTNASGSDFSADVANCLVFSPGGFLSGGSESATPFALGVWEGGVEGGIARTTSKSNTLAIVVNQFTGRASCSGRN